MCDVEKVEDRLREAEGMLEEIGRSVCDVRGGLETWNAINRAVADVQEAIHKAYLMKGE